MAFSAYERRWVARAPRVPIEPPAPRAFDRAGALRTFDRITKSIYAPDWSAARIPPVVGAEEATFWLYAISALDTAWRELREARGAPERHVSVDHAEARAHARPELERLDVAHRPTRATIARRLAATAKQPFGGGSYGEIVIALAALMDLPQLLDTILDEANDAAVADVAADEERRAAAMHFEDLGAYRVTLSIDSTGYSQVLTDEPPQEPTAPPPAAPAPDTAFAVLREWAKVPGRFGPGPGVAQRVWLLRSLAVGFADYVAPYLDAAQFEQARTRVRPAILRALDRPPFTGPEWHRTESFSPAFHLAAALHLTGEVEAVVASWAEHVEIARYLPFLPAIVYGLRTPEAVVAESRRLGIVIQGPAAMREWLATTGETGVEYASEQLAAHATETDADAFIDAVAALEGPLLPGTMLRLTEIPVLYVSARTWLENNLDAALEVLASAAGDSSALGATANEILRRFARRGHPGAAAALTATDRPA